MQTAGFFLVITGLFGCATSGAPVPGPAPVAASAPAPAEHPLIRVETPLPDSMIASPLRIAGQARGQWYFEATFPVKLLDADGTLVTQSFGQAAGEWMTTELVPFEGKLMFAAPRTSTGTLVFEKANASGLPEHDDALRVPVRFAAAR